MRLSAAFQWFCETEKYVPYKADFTGCRVSNPYTVRAKFHTEIKVFILWVMENCVEWANRAQAKLCFVCGYPTAYTDMPSGEVCSQQKVFCDLHDFTNPELYIKSEENNIAVLHNVLLALGADFSLFLCRLH